MDLLGITMVRLGMTPRLVLSVWGRVDLLVLEQLPIPMVLEVLEVCQELVTSQS